MYLFCFLRVDGKMVYYFNIICTRDLKDCFYTRFKISRIYEDQ